MLDFIQPHGLIYKTTNLINNKIYIGQTTKIDTFKKGKYSGSGKYIVSAIKKYGKENFKTEILAYAYSLEQLNNLEQEYIFKFNSLQPIGYNLMTGGKQGGAHSKETREQLSRVSVGKAVLKDKEGRYYKVYKDDPRYLSGELVGTTRGIQFPQTGEKKKGQISAKDKEGRYYKVYKDDPRYLSGELVGVNKGRVFSEAVRKKMSDAGKKKKLTIEHRRKIALSHTGKFHSQETREKLSRAHSGKKLSAQHAANIKESKRKKKK